ncbi:MAG: hypothetical protein LBV04_09725 [Deferribacteraceae bacterium]|jgi:hypothetical protein|nr:hypothetical protein [Deferribacteraceae bacterium]
MKNKILYSLGCAAALALSFFLLATYFGSQDSSFYDGVQDKLNQRFLTASAVFGLTKLVSGILTLIQSIEIEASVVVAGLNIAPLKVLAPVSDTINQLSNLFLWAMGAIVLQKLLMFIAGWAAFKVVIPIACVLLGGYVWTKRVILRNIAVMLIALAVAISATVPISVQVSALVERHFLADIHQQAMEGIEHQEKAFSSLQTELAPGGDKSFLGSLRESLSLTAIQAKIQSAINSALDYGKLMVTDLLNLFIVTLITVLVIPLLTVLALWLMLRWISKKLLQ